METNLSGKLVEGRYRRGGRDSVAMALEVTAHLAITNSFGQTNAYLFGTRMDAGQEGKVVAVRQDCFNPNTMKTSDVKGFKPVDLTGWRITPPGSAAFAFVEKVADEDIEWNKSLGGLAVADLVVGVPKAARKPRAPKTETAEVAA